MSACCEGKLSDHMLPVECLLQATLICDVHMVRPAAPDASSSKLLAVILVRTLLSALQDTMLWYVATMLTQTPSFYKIQPRVAVTSQSHQPFLRMPEKLGGQMRIC